MTIKILTDQERANLPGEFVKLPKGWVHYELTGPENGPVVVLVHGFATPLFVWDPLVPALKKAGFRVLRYDLFGRGFSDRPRIRNNEDLFDSQLLELTKVLLIKQPSHIVGLSMGGAISTIFAARHPEKVLSLTLIAPAGYPVKIPMAAKLVRTPLLGEILMNLFGNKILLNSVTNDFYNQSFVSEYAIKFKEQMVYKGFSRSILSTLRYFNLNDQSASYAALGSQNQKVLLIWGRDDGVVPYENSKKILAALPNARLHSIDQAGHLVHFETPEKANPVIVEFLKDCI